MSQLNKKSAMASHYLQSILPFQTISHQKQFTKTKQFYKPEEFIWNNPHRTSKRMYPYYHQFKDNYDRNIKPKLQQLIENDRTNFQDQRIRKLSEIRNQTRTRFHSRQQLRHQIQSRAGSRKIINASSQISNPVKNEKSNSLRPSRSNRLAVNHTQISVTEQTYNKGVDEYDLQAERIKKIFSAQIMENRQKIRYQFKQRKQANELINSRIKNSTNLFIKN